jgi:type III secretory pathway lipoprotein EscJ
MIILITTLVLALALIVSLSAQLKRDRANHAEVQALLTRANVAVQKLKSQKNYAQEEIDFVIKNTPSKNFFDLV